jgi:hypothetical protein
LSDPLDKRKTLLRRNSLGFAYKESKEKRGSLGFVLSRQKSDSIISDKEKNFSRETDQTSHIDTDGYDQNEMVNGHGEFKKSTASLIMSLNKTVLNSNPIPVSRSKICIGDKKKKYKSREESMPEKMEIDTEPEGNSNNVNENSFYDDISNGDNSNNDRSNDDINNDDINNDEMNKNIANEYRKKSTKNFFQKDINLPENDKDHQIQMLEKEIENMKIKNDNLEDIFQSKISSFIERIIELEDGQEMELIQHEEQIVNLLKASGIYHKSGYDKNNRQNNHDLWIDLFRVQLDDERIKIQTLKTIMMRFSDRLTKADNSVLLDAGIVLVASGLLDPSGN